MLIYFENMEHDVSYRFVPIGECGGVKSTTEQQICRRLCILERNSLHTKTNVRNLCCHHIDVSVD